MKKFYLSFLLSFLSTIIYAQGVNFMWANSVGGTQSDIGQSITIDESGNLYIVGSFYNTVDFDPGAGVFNMSSNGDMDGFIQKLDASGNFIWAISLGSIKYDRVSSLSTDGYGNIYVTGDFSKKVDFDQSLDTFYLKSLGSSDVFILKLDSNANFIWAKSVGGYNNDQGFSITTDVFGNVCLTGIYEHWADFNPSADTLNFNSNGNDDYFILKLDSNGNFKWAKTIGGALNDHGYSITTDATGNIIVTGGFKDTVDFDPGVATFTMITNSVFDSFIQKLDANGNLIWVKQVGGTLNDASYSIIADSLENIYVTGKFKNTVDFDPNSTTHELTSNGDYDVFILKLDANGNFNWAKSFGGSGVDQSSEVILDDLGNVYIGGSFEDVVDFNPSGEVFSLTSLGLSDGFVLILDGIGTFLWAESVGGQSSDFVRSVGVDELDKLYVVGDYKGTVDFDRGATIYELTSNGERDYFVQKLAQWPLGIKTSSLSAYVEVYPNPTTREVNIKLDKEYRNITIQVKDVSGRIISRDSYRSTDLIIQKISGISGMYFMEILSDDGERVVLKVFKK